MAPQLVSMVSAGMEFEDRKQVPAYTIEEGELLTEDEPVRIVA